MILFINFKRIQYEFDMCVLVLYIVRFFIILMQIIKNIKYINNLIVRHLEIKSILMSFVG